MSDFQKNSSNFEDLCLKIVKKLLGNSLNKIKKTPETGNFPPPALLSIWLNVEFEILCRGRRLDDPLMREHHGVFGMVQVKQAFSRFCYMGFKADERGLQLRLVK